MPLRALTRALTPLEYATDSIEQRSRQLDSILRSTKRKHLQIYHTKAIKDYYDFKENLLSLKSELMQLKQQLSSIERQYSEKPIAFIDDTCIELDDLHKNIKSLSLDILEEHVDIVKRLIASLRGFLPITLLELEVNENELLKRIPKDLRDEITSDFAEIRKCFSAQVYRASIAFCGRILESALGRKYYEEKRKLNSKITIQDIENELTNLSFGKIIEKCRDVGLLKDQPDVESYADLINKVRILSIHHKPSKFAPGPDAVKGTVNFMSEVIQKLYS